MRLPTRSLLALCLLLPSLTKLTRVVAQQPQPALAKTTAGGVAEAGAPDAATPLGAAWARFQQQQGGSWWSCWSPATGTPKAILGSGVALPGWREDSLEQARQYAGWFLQQQRELLGLGNSEFRERIGARMGYSWALVYDQYFRGLPVIGGRADVRVHGVGRIPMFGAVAWPIPADFDTTPRVSDMAALAIAWRQVGFAVSDAPQPGVARSPRLVIWGDVTAPARAPFHLAWEIPISNVDAGGQGPIGRYYVDARLGQLLHYQNDKLECGLHTGEDAATAAGAPLPALCTGIINYWVRTGLDATSPTVLVPAAGVQLNVSGVGLFFTDANGHYSINLPFGVSQASTIVSMAGPHNQRVLGVNAPTRSITLVIGNNPTLTLPGNHLVAQQVAHTDTHYWVHTVNEWARTILGNSPELAIADQVIPTVNIALTCNAYYANNTINFYDAGGGCNNTAFSTVITHEWGHGLDARYGGLTNNAGDGLSEAWGDIVAMYCSDDPGVGLGMNTAGVPIRSGNNGTRYPPPQEVHDAGEVFMGFAWQLRDRLAATLGSRAAAIGLTNDIVLGSIVANAQDQVQAVREVFLADDNDGNLANATPHATELSWACARKSLPNPLAPPPANDACSGALAVQNGLNGPFDNRLALNSEPLWPCSNYGSKDLWFRYLAGNGSLTVSTCGQAAFDTTLEVFQGDCGNLVSVGCNDDACGLQSSLTVPVQTGICYIRVGGYNNAAGTFHLDVNGPAPISASATAFGSGCTYSSRAFYESFHSAASFDLSNHTMRLVPNATGDGYTVGTGGTFSAPPGRLTPLALGDDATVGVPLPAPLHYPNGSTSILSVCSNGFVSELHGNGDDPTPLTSAWLGSMFTRWGTWCDFDPAAAGSGGVKYHVLGSVAYVTWDGVYRHGTTSPSTWQLQFDTQTGIVTFVWQTMSTVGGPVLVGYTAGGTNVDLGSFDLSRQLGATFPVGPRNRIPLQLDAVAQPMGSASTFTVRNYDSSGNVGILRLSGYPLGPVIDLGPFGMPTCSMYVGPGPSIVMIANASRLTTYSANIPYIPGLAGMPINAQAFAFAPGANAMGAVSSNGVQLILGF